MKRRSFKFTEKEKRQIREAVEVAEQKTAGEIIPFFAEKSDDYEAVPLKWSIIFMIATLLFMSILSYTWSLPFPITPIEIIIFTLIMGVTGYLIVEYIPALKRFLIPAEMKQERVEQGAWIAFLEEEVFRTANRTGILIYISYFEHLVEVLGDTGINAKVKPEEWQEVVQLIVKGIKSGNPATGIINGIEKCGVLLERAGVDKPPQNPNELPDDIRLG